MTTKPTLSLAIEVWNPGLYVKGEAEVPGRNRFRIVLLPGPGGMSRLQKCEQELRYRGDGLDTWFRRD